jgi:hypothetical protein
VEATNPFGHLPGDERLVGVSVNYPFLRPVYLE